MKTIVIWDQMDGEIKFFVVNKDIIHLNGTYINASEQKYEDELLEILNYGEDGQTGMKLLTQFPIDELVNAYKSAEEITSPASPTVAVITCGFVP